MTQQAIKAITIDEVDFDRLRDGLNYFQEVCHGLAANWWVDLKTGEDLRQANNTPEKLMLIVTEIAEAMEGHRKDRNDDHLPHRKMIEVELADGLIRIGDLGGAKGMSLGDAVVEKLVYNANRADHKIENRKADGGKKC